MKTPFAAGLAALALASLPVSAHAQSSELLETFSMAELQSALNSIGATYEGASDGQTINVTFASSLKANAAIMACTDGEAMRDCYGTSILSIFDPDEGTSEADVIAAINEYNYRENFGRAYLDPEGDVSVRMYIIADGGITRENYRRQIALWAASLEDFTGYLYKN